MSAELSLRRNRVDLFVRAFLGGFWGWAVLAIMGVNRNLPAAVASTAGVLAWFWAVAWIAFVVNWLASRLELSGDHLVRRSLVRRAEVDLADLAVARLEPDRAYADDPSYGRPKLFNTAPDLVLVDRDGGEVRVGLQAEWLGARPVFQAVHEHLRRSEVRSDDRTRTNVAFFAGAPTRARGS